jgi:hypothetical protein
MIALFLFFPREIFGTHFFKNMTREEADRNANNDARCCLSTRALLCETTNKRRRRRSALLFFCLLSTALTFTRISLSLFVRLKNSRCVCARSRSFVVF